MELLRAAGIQFDVLPADIDESVLPGESAEHHVRRLAEAKACAVLPRASGRPVLSADTVVVVAGEILGKPADEADARRMLRLLSGRSHEVMTGVCLRRHEGEGRPLRLQSQRSSLPPSTTPKSNGMSRAVSRATRLAPMPFRASHRFCDPHRRVLFERRRPAGCGRYCACASGWDC